MTQFILEPLGYAFMQRGLAAAALVGIVCAMVGTYVVLRGMAFLGDALAHSILPGVAVGYLVQDGATSALFWWALGTAVLTSVGIGAVSKGARLREDTTIGVLFAGMLALGIAIISTINNYTIDLTHFLFGNVLGVSSQDLWITGIMGGVVILTILALYKEFLVLSFDPTLAMTMRLPTRVLEYLLLILIAAAVVVSLQTVGVALTVAMLVTPAATAYLVTKRIQRMMGMAVLIAAVSGVIGLYLSYYWRIASGAAIVLTCTAFFALVWAGQSASGAIRKKREARATQ